MSDDLESRLERCDYTEMASNPSFVRLAVTDARDRIAEQQARLTQIEEALDHCACGAPRQFLRDAALSQDNQEKR